MKKRRNKQPTFSVICTLVNIQFKIKEVTRYITHNYISTFVIFKMFWFSKQRRVIWQIFNVSFSLLWVVTSANYYLSMKYKYPALYVGASYIFTTLKFTDAYE